MGASTVGAISATSTDHGVLITTLAGLPERALLDENALAKSLKVTKRTVRRMVARFELPPPVSFAGRSMWQVGRVMCWFEKRADRLEREARKAAERFDGISLAVQATRIPRLSGTLEGHGEEIKDR